MYVGVYELLSRGGWNEKYDRKTQSPSQEVMSNDLFMLSNILYDNNARDTS